MKIISLPKRFEINESEDSQTASILDKSTGRIVIIPFKAQKLATKILAAFVPDTETSRSTGYGSETPESVKPGPINQNEEGVSDNKNTIHPADLREEVKKQMNMDFRERIFKKKNTQKNPVSANMPEEYLSLLSKAGEKVDRWEFSIHTLEANGKTYVRFDVSDVPSALSHLGDNGKWTLFDLKERKTVSQDLPNLDASILAFEFAILPRIRILGSREAKRQEKIPA